MLVVFVVLGKLTWKVSQVFTKQDLKTLDAYRQTVLRIAEREHTLYEEYFKSLSHEESR